MSITWLSSHASCLGFGLFGFYLSLSLSLRLRLPLCLGGATREHLRHIGVIAYEHHTEHGTGNLAKPAEAAEEEERRCH